MRKRWLAGLLLAVLAASAIGGVVAADTGDVPPSSESADAGAPSNALIDRAAEVLGVDTATLEEAYQQARDELGADRLQQWLDALMEDGSLTEAEAEAIAGWLDSMPDALGPGPLCLGRVPGPLFELLPSAPIGTPDLRARVAEILGIDAEAFDQALQEATAQLRNERWEQRLDETLDGFVEDGTLTAEEAGDLRQWLDQRPAAADKLPGRGCFFMPWLGPQNPLGDLFHGGRFGLPFDGLLPDTEDGILPRRGMFRGRSRFGHNGLFNGKFEAFEDGFKFRFRFADDAGEITPNRGFKWFGSGHGFKFQMPPAEEQAPEPTPAPAEDTVGELA